MSKFTSLALALGLLVGGTVHATSNGPSSPAGANSGTANADVASGEVRKVDIGAKKITLRHSEIKNLDMPAMTMVFQVNDPALLEKVKAGDKVRFTAEKMNGAITLTSMEVAN